MKHILFGVILISAISCTSNPPKDKESPDSAKPNLNFIGLFPGMKTEEYSHIMDSLIYIGDFEIIKTKNRYKNSSRRTFLSYDHPGANTFMHLEEIGRFFYAVVVTTFWTFDDKLNDIELILGHFSHKDSIFYSICEEEEIQTLLELYQQKYGKPKILERGDNWMRLVGSFNHHFYLDTYNREVYYWEENNLVLFFYVGSKIELEDKDLPPTEFNMVSSFLEWRSNPCILYTYKNEYKKKLIEEKQKKEKSILKDKI